MVYNLGVASLQQVWGGGGVIVKLGTIFVA